MPENFEDRLNQTLKRKREHRDATQKRRSESAKVAELAAAERLALEQKLARTWHLVKVQIDDQIRAVNRRSADLELVAATEDRAAPPSVLAARAIQFNRRPGPGRFDLFIQLARTGTVQYALDRKVIFSGKISQMNAADHDLIVNNVLDFIVAGVPLPVRRNQYTQSRRSRSWREMFE